MVVALVEVEFVEMRLVIVPVVPVRVVMVPEVPERLVAKRLVEVALVLVEFVERRFWKVLFDVEVAVKYVETVSPTTDSFA